MVRRKYHGGEGGWETPSFEDRARLCEARRRTYVIQSVPIQSILGQRMFPAAGVPPVNLSPIDLFADFFARSVSPDAYGTVVARNDLRVGSNTNLTRELRGLWVCGASTPSTVGQFRGYTGHATGKPPEVSNSVFTAVLHQFPSTPIQLLRRTLAARKPPGRCGDDFAQI